LHHDPLNKVVFALLPHFYTNCNQYTQAIATARQFYAQSNTIEDKFCANCLLLQTLMKAGAWKELPEVSKHHKILMKQLIESNSTQLELGTIQFLTVYAGSLAYLQDNLAENRWFQNNAGQLFLKNLQANVPRIFKPVHYQPQTTKPKIRVGYIASTLRNHSVGWLSRWLFKYHDKSSFEIYIYLVQQSIDHPFFQEWFAPYADQYTLLATRYPGRFR
jgi:predicted O-linked N-acetylglucosamine transferase (SPINDLY family)